MVVTTAKGISQRYVIPMGCVFFVSNDILRHLHAPARKHMIELFHGYTYSGQS